MTLGEIIKQYRDENHVSMDTVAQQCGITKGYVAMLEKNVNPKNNRPLKPSIETIIKVCEGLHFDVDSVFSQLDNDYIVRVPAISHSANDICDILQTLISDLRDDEVDLSFKGHKIDEVTRQLLIQQIDNAISICNINIFTK